MTYEAAEAGSLKYKLWSDGPNKQSGDDDDIESVEVEFAR